MSRFIVITLFLTLFVFPSFVLCEELFEPSLPTAKEAAGAPQPIKLRSRTFRPPAGVDPAALRRAREARSAGATTVHLVLQLSKVPDPAFWRILEAAGVVRFTLLGETNWIVEMTLPGDLAARLQRTLTLAEGTTLTVLQPADKVSPRLAERRYEPWAYDRERDLLKVVVRFFPGTSHQTARHLIDSVHRGPAPPVTIDPTFWAIQIHPADLDKVSAAEAVHDVDLGPLPQLPLMKDARWKTGVEEVQNIDLGQSSLYAKGLSGKGIRISNSEGFDTAHDDFWNHDATGQRTTPRWPATCSAAGSAHGTMTAGIALGNGFLSSQRGGTAYQWRGIAPEAIYDCGSTADVQNFSFVQTYGEYSSWAEQIDSDIRGDNNGNLTPQVWAVANQGIDSQYGTEVGYYSVYAPAKNPLVVANLSAATLRWMFSSIGPTRDGRIKPDLAAPGTKEMFPEDKTQLLFDLDSIKVVQGSSSLIWTFNGTQSAWHGGWAQQPWWGLLNIGPVSQITESSLQAMRLPILAPPYGVAFANAPLVGTLTMPDGATPLSITGSASDTVEIRYRLESDALWQPARAAFTWVVNPSTYQQKSVGFEVIADGAWHTVVLPVGKEATWKGVSGIDYLFLRFGGVGMLSAGNGGAYVGAGGSSAAAPVVSGAMALLMDQVVQTLGVQPGTHTSSPFWFGAPGTGAPLPSTFKALLIHGAQDLASLPHPDERYNPDTNARTVYHQGPDLVTGYGVIDVAESARVVAAHTAAQPYILERSLGSGGLHVYNITVPPSPRGPLKVTLAWDDKAADPLWDETAPALVNDINLSLVGPDNKVYHPYSIDPPYVPSDASQYPGAVEPEPITAADIRPARQDKANDRDNVEQVYVETPLAGTWKVQVKGFKLYAGPQKYSLVLGSPSRTASHLTGGKVVFSSDRVSPQQLFVKKVGSNQPPQQVTSGFFAARYPEWSRNGKYIVYITTDVIVGGGSNQVDVLTVIDEAGALKYQFHAPSSPFSVSSFGYPRWSDDGQRILVSFWSSWGARGLGLIEFAAPYQFNMAAARVLVPQGVGVNDLDPAEGVFSKDGRFVYFNADSGLVTAQLYRIPLAGGAPTEVHGGAAPVRRAYAPSMSPDGTRIIYNSEMWREDPVLYLDEELLEVGLLSGVIRRLTREPGNQYGYFAKNGAGEMILQSSGAAAAKTDLFLEENGTRVPLDVSDPSNAFNDTAPDWWKSPCGGGDVLWANNEPVGCKFLTWGPEQRNLCGSWVPLGISGNGSCAVCVTAVWVDPILQGAWGGLTEGPDASTAQPADLACRACVLPPAQMAGWWPLDEPSGPLSDLMGGAAGTRVGGVTTVPGKVNAGLKLNGSGGYAQVPSSAQLNVGAGDFSLDAWVQIAHPADQSSIRVIAEKRTQGPWRGYSLFLLNGEIGLQLADGLGSQYSNFLAGVKVPADGAWHLVALTVDRDNGTGGRFYLDGDPAGAPFNPTGRQGSLNNNGPLRIGSVSLSTGSSFFKGSLDEVELFHRVLTPFEIRSLYLAGPYGKCRP